MNNSASMPLVWAASFVVGMIGLCLLVMVLVETYHVIKKRGRK